MYQQQTRNISQAEKSRLMRQFAAFQLGGMEKSLQSVLADVEWLAFKNYLEFVCFLDEKLCPHLFPLLDSYISLTKVASVETMDDQIKLDLEVSRKNLTEDKPTQVSLFVV